MANGGPTKKLIDEGFYTYKKNASPGLCWVRCCGRKRKSDRCMCHMHYQRRWRALNPETNDFNNLKTHAKARKIEFTITIDYWLGLTDAYCFYKKNDDNLVLSIDRVDPTKGYEPGNLRVVSLAVNGHKGQRERYLPEHVQAVLARKRDEAQKDNAQYLDCDPEWVDDIPMGGDEPSITDENPF